MISTARRKRDSLRGEMERSDIVMRRESPIVQDGIHHRVPAPRKLCRPQHGLRVIASRGENAAVSTSSSALIMGLGCAGGASSKSIAPTPG